MRCFLPHLHLQISPQPIGGGVPKGKRKSTHSGAGWGGHCGAGPPPAGSAERPGGTRMFNQARLAAKQRNAWLSYRMQTRFFENLVRYKLAPAIGLEPITYRLTEGSSSAKLRCPFGCCQPGSPALRLVMGLQQHYRNRIGMCRRVPFRPRESCGAHPQDPDLWDSCGALDTTGRCEHDSQDAACSLGEVRRRCASGETSSGWSDGAASLQGSAGARESRAPPRAASASSPSLTAALLQGDASGRCPCTARHRRAPR